MITRSSSLALLALVVTGSLSLGCSEQPQSKTAMEVLAAEAAGATQMPPGSAAGRSPNLKPGAPLGLWIGRGASGEYFLRTTTMRTAHRFQGRIKAINGEITNFRATRMDLNDRSKVDGQDTVFDISTQADEDGFDFGVSKNACVEFTIRIDGQGNRDHIRVGEKEANPASSKFIVCPQ
jgi:hypothetical protein